MKNLRPSKLILIAFLCGASTSDSFAQTAKAAAQLNAPFQSKIDAPYLRKGFYYIQHGNPDLAVQQFDHCKELKRLNIPQLTKVVWTYTDVGEHVKALPSAVMLVERVKSSKQPLANDQIADAYQCRLVCFEATQQFAKAAEDYQLLMRLRPERVAQLADGAGECYRKLGKFPQAISMYDKAIALKKNDPVMQYHKALCLDEKGKWSEGIVLLDTSFKLCMEERRKCPDVYSQFVVDLLKERLRCHTKLRQYAKADADKKALGELDSAWADTLFGGK